MNRRKFLGAMAAAPVAAVVAPVAVKAMGAGAMHEVNVAAASPLPKIAAGMIRAKNIQPLWIRAGNLAAPKR